MNQAELSEKFGNEKLRTSTLPNDRTQKYSRFRTSTKKY